MNDDPARSFRATVARMTASNVDLSAPCEHASHIKIHHVRRPAAGCEDCLKIGGEWVHLRECLTCSHIGCCDSSPNRHATKHFHASRHPIVTSVEPGETWTWCYVDERFLSE
jgi:uncharacterized UBP type Zn finger protein